MMKTAVFLMIALGLSCLQAQAQTSVVVPPGTGTLQSAYDTASHGDTLILQNGEQYNITSLMYIDKKITFMAQDWVALPGLENMPVIYNQNSVVSIFQMGDGCDLSVIGISMDGNNGYYIISPKYEYGAVIDLYINRCRLYNAYSDIMTAPASNNVTQTFLRSFTIENSFLYDSQGHGIYTKGYEGGGEPWIFRNITYWNLGQQLTWIRVYPEEITQELIFDHITGYNLSTNESENKELIGNSDVEGEAALDIDLKNSILSNQASDNEGSLKFNNTSGRHDISLTHLLLHEVQPIMHLGGTIHTSNIDETSNPQFNDPGNQDFTVMNTALYDAADDGLILGALYWHPEYVDAGDTAVPQIIVSPVNMLFDTVYTQTENTLELQIANYGNATLEIDTLFTNADAFEVSGDVSAISAMQSHTLEVTFNTSEQGAYNHQLYIVNNSETDTVVVELQAHALHPPVMTVSPGSIDEILTEQHESSQLITIQNEGEGGALDYSISLEDFNPANSSWLSLDKTTGLVEAGEDEEITAAFSAVGMSLGIYEANIVITDNDSVNDRQVIPVKVEITDNVPPQIVAPVQYITDYITMEKTTLDLQAIFKDTEDDVLRFDYEVEHDTLIYFIRNGSELTLQYKNPGTTKVYLHATDQKDFTVTDTFTVEIMNNHAPVIGQSIDDIVHNLNESVLLTIPLQDVFHDEDGDDLYYKVKSSDTTVANVSSFDSTDNKIIIIAQGEGFSVIDVEASDDKSLKTARDKFVITFEDVSLTADAWGILNPQFNVFPTPARNSITISLKLGTAEKAIFAIYDISGNLVGMIHPEGKSRDYEINYSVSHLEEGMYILKATTKGNGNGLFKKIVIAR